MCDLYKWCPRGKNTTKQPLQYPSWKENPCWLKAEINNQDRKERLLRDVLKESLICFNAGVTCWKPAAISVSLWKDDLLFLHSSGIKVSLCVTHLRHCPFSSLVLIMFSFAVLEWLGHNVNVILKPLCLSRGAEPLRRCFFPSILVLAGRSAVPFSEAPKSVCAGGWCVGFCYGYLEDFSLLFLCFQQRVLCFLVANSFKFYYGCAE